ncbi:hypothetical protein [Oceanithermus desulfurans]|uniref:Uncharacterized protein n=2 Tax=Oceanithermus desulfurans TaxID=227924 RepID=A0A511RM93_9DEIN|nr:hypothetical protein [Oceanithermus desulfurans]MBB6030447.1 hypothetical protein [Oceanithermus desulfurans]GEM90783.1 hypothetical protein ODE01S_22170 [Oceanithermus desulfurans NBRC 100063]
MMQKTKYVLIGLFISALGLWGLAVTVPNSFSSGDVVSASKMNENFQALKSAVDALEAKVAFAAVGRALIRWNDPDATVDTDWSLNTSGGAIEVERLSAGRYNVTFKDLAASQPPYGTALAGSRDFSGGHCNVTVVKEESTYPDVVLGVRCFDEAGTLQDGVFRVVYLR